MRRRCNESPPQGVPMWSDCCLRREISQRLAAAAYESGQVETRCPLLADARLHEPDTQRTVGCGGRKRRRCKRSGNRIHNSADTMRNQSVWYRSGDGAVAFADCQSKVENLMPQLAGAW